MDYGEFRALLVDKIQLYIWSYNEATGNLCDLL